MRFIRVNPLLAVVVLTTLFIPTIAHAQRGARAAAPARSMTAPHRFTTASGYGSARSRHHGREFENGGFANNGFFSNSLGLGQISFFPNLNYGVGVNGINYIATQDVGTEAAIDPATQWRLAIAQRVAGSTGVFGGGYYLLGGGGYAYPSPADSGESEQAGGQPQQQPQMIVVQQAPAQSAQTAPQPAEQAVAEQPPLPDAGQFTLVLHNGTQIEAVAFTQMKDHIVYITRDGSRRILSLGDLDKDATIRVNQERGTPLQFPL